MATSFVIAEQFHPLSGAGQNAKDILKTRASVFRVMFMIVLLDQGFGWMPRVWWLPIIRDGFTQRLALYFAECRKTCDC